MSWLLLVSTALAWEPPRLQPIPPPHVPEVATSSQGAPGVPGLGTVAVIEADSLPADRFAVVATILASDRVGAEVGSRAWEAATRPRLEAAGVTLDVAATGAGWRWAAEGPADALGLVLEVERERSTGGTALDPAIVDAAYQRWQAHRAAAVIDTWGRRLRLVAPQLVDPAHVFADVGDGSPADAARVATRPAAAVVFAARELDLQELVGRLGPIQPVARPDPASVAAPRGPAWAVIDARVDRPEVVLAWTVPLGHELPLASAADLRLGRRLHGLDDVVDRPRCSAVRDVVAAAVICVVPVRSADGAERIAERARRAASRRFSRRERAAGRQTAMVELATVLADTATGEPSALIWAAWRYAEGQLAFSALAELPTLDRRNPWLTPDRGVAALLVSAR